MTPSQFAWNAVHARDTLPHGERPTDLHIRIAWLLARWQNPCPSHAKLARAAHCHRNSVVNALHRFRDLGLLSWQHQTTRLCGGWVARTVNRYLFKASEKLSKISNFVSAPKLVQRGSGSRTARPVLPTRDTGADLLKARRKAWAAGRVKLPRSCHREAPPAT